MIPRRSPRSWPRPYAPLGAVLAALFTLGCALTSKSEPLSPRYFSPERAQEPVAPPPSSSALDRELRIGRVTGVAYLDERLVYRDSAYELGYYHERRWTEEPARYLDRRLAHVLFERRGLRQVVGGAAATLDVELIAFEEIRAPLPIARVRLVVKLRDQRLVRWGATVTVDEPIVVTPNADRAEGMVEALGRALRAAVDRVADRVLIELAKPPPASSGDAPAAARAAFRLGARASVDRR